MKIVFVSNFLNHHQLELCEELYDKLGANFVFVATSLLPEERKKLGYKEMSKGHSFLIETYNNKDSFLIAKKKIIEADAVIFGSAPQEYYEIRKKTNKLIIRYSERLFKKGTYRRFIPNTRKKIYNNFYKNYNQQFTLAASAYLAYDLSLMGYQYNILKWGYFPRFVENINFSNLKQNNKVLILWVGRLIDWKRPFDAIKVARKLKKDGFAFTLNIVGTGPLKKKMEKMLIKNQLQNDVFLLGSMSPESVREEMLKSNIYLFTSNHQEGWGAVLNEAMNSGCAIVANQAIGAVPFLLKNEINGFTYRNKDFKKLYANVVRLINDEKLRLLLGKNAYNTIKEKWNAKVAAERLVNAIDTFLKGKNISELYSEGICSKATIIKNNYKS